MVIPATSPEKSNFNQDETVAIKNKVKIAELKNTGWCFPTLIYRESLTTGRARKDRFLEALVRECYQLRDFDEAGRRWCRDNYPFGYTSYGSMSELYSFSSSFDELRIAIDAHVKKFAKKLQWNLAGGQLRMQNLWVNINGPASYHGLHLHPLSVVSGTIYIQVPSKSGSLKFEDPRMAAFMGSPTVLENAGLENQRFLTIEPKEGEIVLFESWLRHEVTQNHSQKDRISASFNYQWC